LENRGALFPVTLELIMATLNTHEQFLRQAIALASQARSEGNHPFGALLVLDGQVVLTAKNSVTTDHDPTGHAETNLVARAIREFAPEQLGRAVLYTSCEPCAMCVGKMYWAGVRFVVYALSAEELAVLAGPDFLVPCRDLFARAAEAVTVLGPMLVDEARAVHVGFWNKATI
jgi:tRNA(Arg) A34 adenosine deaminase TadA